MARRRGWPVLGLGLALAAAAWVPAFLAPGSWPRGTPGARGRARVAAGAGWMEMLEAGESTPAVVVGHELCFLVCVVFWGSLPFWQAARQQRQFLLQAHTKGCKGPLRCWIHSFMRFVFRPETAAGFQHG